MVLYLLRRHEVRVSPNHPGARRHANALALALALASTDLYLPLLFADVMRFTTAQIGMLQAARRVLRLVGAVCSSIRPPPFPS